MGAPGKKMKDYRQAQIVRLDIIAQLYKRGYSYREIREEVMARLGLDAYSLRTVHKDVNTLLEEWRETRIENFDLSVQLELERIDDMIKEAWAAWDKSKTDYERKKAKQQGVPGGGDEGEGVITVKMEQQNIVQNRKVMDVSGRRISRRLQRTSNLSRRISLPMNPLRI